MANSENTITTVFVNILRHMRDAWSVNENIKNYWTGILRSLSPNHDHARDKPHTQYFG